jgi:hypothetical protein
VSVAGLEAIRIGVAFLDVKRLPLTNASRPPQADRTDGGFGA